MAGKIKNFMDRIINFYTAPAINSQELWREEVKNGTQAQEFLSSPLGKAFIEYLDGLAARIHDEELLTGKVTAEEYKAQLTLLKQIAGYFPLQVRKCNKALVMLEKSKGSGRQAPRRLGLGGR